MCSKGRLEINNNVRSSLTQIQHTHSPTSVAHGSIPQSQHLNRQNLRAHGPALDKPYPRRMARRIPPSITSLLHPTGRHHITQRPPHFPEAEDANLVLMFVIDIDEHRALLPREMNNRRELDAFVAGGETPAVPPVG